MATLLTEMFEGGSPGQDITPSNSAFSNIVGATPTYDSDAIEGNLSAHFNPANQQSMGRADFPAQTSAWVSFYIKTPLQITTPTYITSFFHGNTRIGDLRLAVDGSLAVRDNFNAVITTPSLLQPDKWARIALRIEPGAVAGLHLRAYTGSNLHSTTPSNGSAGQTAASTVAATAIDNYRLGVVTASDADILLDRIIIDNSTEPEPLDSLSSTNAYVYIEGAWVPGLPHVYDGTSWRTAHTS